MYKLIRFAFVEALCDPLVLCRFAPTAVDALCDADVLADSLALVEALCDADVHADSEALGEALRAWTLKYYRSWLLLVEAPWKPFHACGFAGAG